MTKLTLARLYEILRDYADRDESATQDLSSANGDESFDQLGFDSLAHFNAVTRIEDDFRISLPFDLASTAQTPNSLISLVNARLS